MRILIAYFLISVFAFLAGVVFTCVVVAAHNQEEDAERLRRRLMRDYPEGN